MSENMEGTLRRTRRFGVIAGLILLAGGLAGCSAGADDAYAYEAPADTGADFGYADEGYADEGYAEEPATDVSGRITETRAVIVTGYLYMTVEDPTAAAEKAADIVQDAGGRVDARKVTAASEYDGGSAYLTLRIPSGELDDVVDDLGELGAVDEYSTDSYDVSVEVTDLESKISTLRDSTARVQALLDEATTLSDIIYLENELSNRQANLQSLEAQQRGLDDQVSMSTIDLSLTTEPVEIVEILVEDDSPKSFWDGLMAGWDSLSAFVSVALVVIGVLLPWLALIAIIVAAVVIPIRMKTARDARKWAALAPAEPPAPPAA